MITSPIHASQNDPIGQMLLDYLNGRLDGRLEVKSDKVVIRPMTARKMFRLREEMNELELAALNLCRGKILDIGAGSGCHTLLLQEAGHDVEAIEISPGAVETMKRRGVKKVLHESVFSLRDSQYDTLLMLMNGIGLCETLDGLNLFLQLAKRLLLPGGQILTDSSNITVIDTGRKKNHDDTAYPGEVLFRVSYGESVSDVFGWLYVDYEKLERMALWNGYTCRKVASHENQYLACLELK